MNVIVIGQGIMGKGISSILKANGFLAESVSARGLISGDSVAIDKIQLANCIIECAQEDIIVKEKIYKIIDKINPDVFIGTCTSSFSISNLQKAIKNSSNLCGVHFMNPPRAIADVELIAGRDTSEATLQFFSELLIQVGKKPTTVPDTPGFIVNAILFSLLNRAAYVIDETKMEPTEVDNLMTGVCGFKIGPLATLDLIGIDTAVNILLNLNSSDPSTNLPPANILISKRELGHLGRKTKIGFYKY